MIYFNQPAIPVQSGICTQIRSTRNVTSDPLLEQGLTVVTSNVDRLGGN